MSGEVVSLHIGQAGVQMGNALWELFCVEHLIYPDGRLADPSKPGTSVLFYETSGGTYVPRVVFADLEPTCIDEIRVGEYHQLFGGGSMISGKEDAASNFARGYYTVGNEMSELCCEHMRKQVERCGSIQGIAIFRSFGGGTGSGFAANIMDKFTKDFGQIPLVEFCIYPSPRIASIIVEPYNAVLTTHSTIGCGSCSFLFDNQSIYDICDKHLNVPEPSYTNLNRLIAQVVSGVTSPLRFPGTLDIKIKDFQTNLVPYPRIHFPLVSFSPFLPISRVAFETLNSGEMIKEAFSPANQMIKCETKDGKYMACVLFLRGDMEGADVNSTIGDIKSMPGVEFVDYSPSGFKIGHSGYPMAFVPGSDLAAVPRSLVMLSNHSAIGGAWERVNSKFNILFGMRSFVHHYVGEGMEEREFVDAQEDLKQLVEDYKTSGS